MVFAQNYTLLFALPVLVRLTRLFAKKIITSSVPVLSAQYPHNSLLFD